MVRELERVQLPAAGKGGCGRPQCGVVVLPVPSQRSPVTRGRRRVPKLSHDLRVQGKLNQPAAKQAVLVRAHHVSCESPQWETAFPVRRVLGVVRLEPWWSIRKGAAGSATVGWGGRCVRRHGGRLEER